jgi:hypothetical protein
MCSGGAALQGKCLPRPPSCDPGDPNAGQTCLAKCEYKPSTNDFSPIVKYSWGEQITSPYATDVMMTPIVVQLDDDDCDMKVTDRDIPDIVFSTFANGSYKTTGSLHAISIINGMVKDKWELPNLVNPTKQLAGGNLDGTSGSEVVACLSSGKVGAFHGSNGGEYWTSPDNHVCFMPAIADMDGDGFPEVIVEDAILNGQTGAIKATFTPPLNSPPIISDIDGDGFLDVVTASRGYHADGTMFVDSGVAADGSFAGSSDWKGPWPAVADFNNDGAPEVVSVDNTNHSVTIWRYNDTQPQKFEIVRNSVNINGALSPALCGGGSWGNTHGGGPPTIGHFNNDGIPDIALAGGIGYAVFDGSKLLNPAVPPLETILWIKQTTDCSSASTGSSLFDFNGDGVAEVVYSDETKLRIYEGPTGNVLFETCNTTATLIENPIIADVDNDGQADIVAVSNAYGKTCVESNVTTRQSGVRVFGSALGSWVRTRRTWNQHSYHITNIEEDGTVPMKELPNWQQPGLNNFRLNKQPGSEFAAPDVVVSLKVVCGQQDELVATVRNVGQAALPPGVQVDFYVGMPGTGTLLGSGVTTGTLYAAQSELVKFSPTDPLITQSNQSLYAIVIPPMAVHECRTDNNESAVILGTCKP